MSRNKIEMSTYIFDQIHASALAQDSQYLDDQNIRWLAAKDEADLRLMTNAAVEVLTLGVKTFAVSIKNGEDCYFCFSGLAVPAQLPVNLHETDATPGLFSCVVVSAGLKAVATASQARNVLEQQYRGQAGYRGHELSEIAPLFPELYFIKVNSGVNAPYLEKLDRVAGTYVATGYPGHPLAIDSNLRARIIALFEAGAESIPYSLPLQGLLSYNWPSLFLDLYRCLEQLYTALKLIALVAKMPYEGSLADLAYLLEEELSWRPREQDALASLLAQSSEETRSQILAAFKFNVSELSEYSATKCAKNIYQLRNSHVHFRPAMRAELKDADQWNEIIIAMCDAVDDVYEALGVEFLKNRPRLSPAVETFNTAIADD